MQKGVITNSFLPLYLIALCFKGSLFLARRNEFPEDVKGPCEMCEKHPVALWFLENLKHHPIGP